MADPPASIPEHWQLCSAARRFREAVNSTTTPTLSEPGSEGVWFKRGTEMRDGSTAANLWYTKHSMGESHESDVIRTVFWAT